MRITGRPIEAVKGGHCEEMTCKLSTQAAEKLGLQVCKDLEKGEVHLSNFVACGWRVTSSSLGQRGMKDMGGPIKESNLYLNYQDKSLKDFKQA